MNTSRSRSVLELVNRLAGSVQGVRENADEASKRLLMELRSNGGSEFFAEASAFVAREQGCPGLCLGPDHCLMGLPCGENDDVYAANKGGFEMIQRVLDGRRVPVDEPVVLLGDGGVLLGLYSSLCAFRGSLWVAACRWLEQDEDSGTFHAIKAVPSELQIGRYGKMAEFVDELCVEEEIAGRKWLAPTRELLLALMAARVGNADAAPWPPMWVHLAVGLKAWQGEVDMDRVIEIGERLALSPQVNRGLAVVAEMIPEVRGMVSVDRLGIPAWERLLALPLSARRLMAEAVGE